MGAAAENRYRTVVRRQADAAAPSLNDLFIADLNALPKLSGAPAPFGDIVFVNSHGGWWAECPITGFGYFYKSLREAVSSFLVTVVIDGGRLVGVPGRSLT